MSEYYNKFAEFNPCPSAIADLVGWVEVTKPNILYQI